MQTADFKYTTGEKGESENRNLPGWTGVVCVPPKVAKHEHVSKKLMFFKLKLAQHWPGDFREHVH